MRLINPLLWRMDNLVPGNQSYQIQEFIIEKIKEGLIRPGCRLPSQRDFKTINKVNANAVKKAYLNLASLGYIKTLEGSGTFLSKDIAEHGLVIKSSEFEGKLPIPIYLQKKPAPKNSVIHNFITVGMETLNPFHFPERPMFKYQRQQRKRYQHVTQMDQVIDLNGLAYQEAIRNYYNNLRDFNIGKECIQILMGRAESLNRVLGLLLKSGDIMVNTAPQDQLLNDCLRRVQAKEHALNTLDPDFIDKLNHLLKTSKIKMIYLRPQCSYPESGHLSTETCITLLDLAKKHKFYILEEDEYHEFWYKKDPYTALACYPHQGHVIYLGVLSQLSVYMLNTRVLIANKKIVSLLNTTPAPICEFRCVIEENAIVELLNSGELWHYVKQARREKLKDCDKLYWSLDNYLGRFIKIIKPDSGLCFWLEFPEVLDLKEAMGFLEAEDVDVPFKPGMAPQLIKIFNMRLGFGTFNLPEAQQAAKLLSKKFIELGL